MFCESKLSLKKVFDNFDLDKSGYIDGKELLIISKELGEEMT